MPEEFSGEKKILDLSEEMPLVEGVETDEELLLAMDLTKFFIKSIKAHRFYPPENPTLKGFQDQLPKKFNFFLNKYASLIYRVGEYDLSFKGKILYENRDVKTSLAFMMYKDGIRELRFTKGLEEWEIQGVVDIFRRGECINQLEDDFVTLIWERDFLHIGYVATDEFLDDIPVVIPDTVDQFRKDLVFMDASHEVEVDFIEEDGEGFESNEILSKLLEELESPLPNRSVYSLASDELERLRKDVESETDPSSVFNITDILFEILAVEKEPVPWEDAINFLNKMLDAFLTLGEFKLAGDLLRRIYMLFKANDLKDWQVEILTKFILEAGEEPRIDRVGKVLEKEEGVRMEEVSGYLVLLQKNAIKSLIKLLAERKKSKTRRLLCDALSEVGKNAIDLFTPFLEDSRWFLVRNIIYILGRIGKEEALPYVQRALNHEEVRVRREGIQALGLIGGSKASGMLVKALTDEDSRIRAMAAINLGKTGKKAGLLPLLEVVQSKEFPKKESDEIRAFFEAIGMVGSNESLPILQQLLEKKSWFARGKTDEIRIGAANAMAMIGTPEARAILDAGRASKDEALQDACLQALRRKASKEPVV